MILVHSEFHRTALRAKILFAGVLLGAFGLGFATAMIWLRAMGYA